MPACCKYLQRAVLRGSSSSSNQQQQQQPGVGINIHQCPNIVLASAAQQGQEGFPDDISKLRLNTLIGVIRCLTCTGEYVEALAPFLTHQGVECCCQLLQAWQQHGILLNEVLQIVCSLLAHRRFGELLVDQGGVQLLLELPRYVWCYLMGHVIALLFAFDIMSLD